MLFSDLSVSDGKIIKIESTASDLKITFIDWRNHKWVISFYEVLSMQSMCVENEELSHIRIVENDDFKSAVLKYYSDEVSDRFYSYNFYGAWSDIALLKIIATGDYNINNISDIEVNY